MKKDAYVINVHGQKLYFECSYPGFIAIHYLSMKLDTYIQFKVVKVSIDKKLLVLSDFLK